jgi:hemolysin activation/secretion protein
MNKLLTLLTFIVASTGIYFAVGALTEPTTPVAVVMPQDAASSPAAAEPVEEEVVDEKKSAPAAVDASVVAKFKAVEVLKPAEIKPSDVKPSEVKLVIREIKFDGVTAFSHDELKGVVSEFVGQELTVEQAMSIPAKISKYYQDRNLVARATLVGSLARDGVIKVGVIETQVKQTQLDKDLTAMAAVTPKAEAPIVAAPTLTAPMVVAPIVDAPKPEVNMAARFAEMSPSIPLPEPKQDGKLTQEQETEFILSRYAKSSRQYELLVDNYGYEATGQARVGVGLIWNNALARQDKLSLQGLKSQGSQYMQAAYEWATGVQGLKLGASVSAFNFDVVNGVQSAVNLSGDAIKKTVQVAYDLVNNPSSLSTLGLRYDLKSLNTKAANFADSAYYDTRVMGIEFKGIEREMVPGGAVLTYNATLSSGNVDMDGSPNQAADLSGEQTAGAFAKLRFSGTILQPLSGINSVYGALTVQRANKNLDGSEKIYLGGPLGVRAYGVGEGMGSDGELATLEFRQKLTSTTTLAEFYDWGHVRPWHNDTGTGAPADNSAILQGFGLSLSTKMDSGVTLKGTWARRLGKEPNTAAMPRGHAGEYDRNRLWLSMESRF